MFDDWNYTSNVAAMWRDAIPPDGLLGFDGKKAGDCLPILEAALLKMAQNKARYVAMEPENGWGSFEGQFGALVELASDFAKAPNAVVRVCS